MPVEESVYHHYHSGGGFQHSLLTLTACLAKRFSYDGRIRGLVKRLRWRNKRAWRGSAGSEKANRKNTTSGSQSLLIQIKLKRYVESKSISRSFSITQHARKPHFYHQIPQRPKNYPCKVGPPTLKKACTAIRQLCNNRDQRLVM